MRVTHQLNLRVLIEGEFVLIVGRVELLVCWLESSPAHIVHLQWSASMRGAGELHGRNGRGEEEGRKEGGEEGGEEGGGNRREGREGEGGEEGRGGKRGEGEGRREEGGQEGEGRREGGGGRGMVPFPIQIKHGICRPPC